MARKAIAMLIATLVVVVCYNGNNTAKTVDNSNLKSENTALVQSVQEDNTSIMENSSASEDVEVSTAMVSSNNSGTVTTRSFSRGGSLGRTAMLSVTEQFKADMSSGKLDDVKVEDSDSAPQTVTVSVKKDLKKAVVIKPISQRIADYAYTFSKQSRAQRGLKPIPYRYGATGPNSFDCSGFVGYVYRHFGYSLGRTTGDLVSEGKSVSRKDLKPGDLVFPHSGHVMIYIGNGQVVHAPETGDVVKVASLPGSTYAIRRIVK